VHGYVLLVMEKWRCNSGEARCRVLDKGNNNKHVASSVEYTMTVVKDVHACMTNTCMASAASKLITVYSR